MLNRGWVGTVFTALIGVAMAQTGHPEYTLVVRETFNHPEGPPAVTVTVTRWTRADGSYVESRRTPQKEEVRAIVDLSTGTETVLQPSTKTKTTYSRNKSSLKAALAEGAKSCASLAPPVDSGLPDLKVMEVAPIVRPGAAGQQVRTERWYAPGAGCYPIREITTVILPNGSSAGTMIREPVSFTPGPIDQALFTIPPDYIEQSASQPAR